MHLNIDILLFRWYAGGASWLHHNKRETQRDTRKFSSPTVICQSHPWIIEHATRTAFQFFLIIQHSSWTAFQFFIIIQHSSRTSFQFFNDISMNGMIIHQLETSIHHLFIYSTKYFCTLLSFHSFHMLYIFVHSRKQLASLVYILNKTYLYTVKFLFFSLMFTVENNWHHWFIYSTKHFCTQSSNSCSQSSFHVHTQVFMFTVKFCGDSGRNMYIHTYFCQVLLCFCFIVFFVRSQIKLIIVNVKYCKTGNM